MKISKELDLLVRNLELNDYRNNIETILIEINNKHPIKVAESLERQCGEHSITIKMENQTLCWSNHPGCVNNPKCETILLVNPNPINLLNGDNMNWIWALMHELGHQRDPTEPILDNKEKREVNAWQNAAIIFEELNFDESLREKFKNRAIFALDKYLSSGILKSRYSWVHINDKFLLIPE